MQNASPRKSPSIFGVGFLVFSATLIWSIGGFVYSALAGRFLTIEQYGTLYAMISLYAVAIIPAGVFSPVISRFAAEFEALEDEGHARGLFLMVVKIFGALGLVYILFPLVFPNALSALLHIQPQESMLVGLMAAISMMSLALRAISQGIHRYRLYSVSIVSEGLGRVVGLLALTAIGLTVVYAAWGFFAGLFAGGAIVAIALVQRYARFAQMPVRFDWKRMAQSTLASSALAVAMGVMGYLDVVLVKHYFSGSQAGLYAAASLVGKILLYVVSFIPAVLIPQATDRHTRGERTRYVLWGAFGIVAVVAVVGLALYVVEGHWLLFLFVGKKYEVAQPLLAIYAVAMAALAITNTFASYAVATHRLHFVWPLFATTAATLVAIVAFHPSLLVVAWEMAAGNVSMLAVTGLALLFQSARPAITIEMS